MRVVFTPTFEMQISIDNEEHCGPETMPRVSITRELLATFGLKRPTVAALTRMKKQRRRRRRPFFLPARARGPRTNCEALGAFLLRIRNIACFYGPVLYEGENLME